MIINNLEALPTDGTIAGTVFRFRTISESVYWLFNGLGNSINSKIEKIYNSQPKYLLEGNYTISQALKLLIKHEIDLIPVVNHKKKIVNIVELDTLLKSKNKIIKNKKNLNIFAVIMAGGLGTRLRPFTKVLPKPLVPVNNKPIIDHIIDRFKGQGFCRQKEWGFLCHLAPRSEWGLRMKVFLFMTIRWA